jgi:hypothetical protein
MVIFTPLLPNQCNESYPFPMKFFLRPQSFFVGTLLLSLTSSLLFLSPARAEYVPQYTSIGKVITVSACLPKNAKSPIYLQSVYRRTVTNLAKITFSKLKLDKECATEAPSFGNYRLTYKWKVNVSGEHFLEFYVPNLKESFSGAPDGIISKKIATAAPTANPQDVILNQPAANFFIPGSALVTLQQVWGINVNSASGPKTFRQVADEIYLYLCRSVGGKVTQSDLEIGFQYGNSMQSFFSRLIDNVWAYQAMKDRLIFNSNQ